MIEINLLPDENKKSKRRTTSNMDLSRVNIQALPVVKIALVCAGIIVFIQALVFALGLGLGSLSKSMTKEYSAIEPEKEETQVIEHQTAKLARKVSAIDELMVKQFIWAKKLNDLSNSVTPGIWLTELEYNEDVAQAPKGESAPAQNVTSKRLVISGNASSMGEEGTALIGKFIQSLKSNPGFYADFSEINLGKIRREKIDDQEVMTFEITCLFK